MPDFSLDFCHDYWDMHSDPMVYKALCFMESLEDWAADQQPEVDEAVNHLGLLLENIDNIDLKHADEFINVAAYVKATRNLMLLQTLNEGFPGAVAKLVKHAEAEAHENNTYRIFLERHVLFERLRLLGSIFSPEASKKIKEILESS